jgi:hypothetical protein
MSEGWKDRLFKAIKEDGRSDRGLSLAAGLGPNFVGQLRGAGKDQPKDPSVGHLAKLADTLSISMAEIFGGTAPRTKIKGGEAIRDFLSRVDGLPDDKASIVLDIILSYLPSASSQTGSPSDGRSAPASRRREEVPSR